MFKITYHPDGKDSFILIARSRDVSFWERTTKGASMNALAENPKMALIENLAWCVARRQSKYDGTLEQFQESTDIEFDPEDDDDELNPTQTVL